MIGDLLDLRIGWGSGVGTATGGGESFAGIAHPAGQRSLSGLGHDDAALGVLKAGDQGHRLLIPTNGTPRKPHAVGGAQRRVAFKTGQFFGREDVLLVRSWIVRVGIRVVKDIDDQAPVDRHRQLGILAMKHDPAPETSHRAFSRRMHRGGRPHGYHLFRDLRLRIEQDKRLAEVEFRTARTCTKGQRGKHEGRRQEEAGVFHASSSRKGYSGSDSLSYRVSWTHPP